MQDKIIIGRFASTYGVRGWLKVISYTDPIDNILKYPNWQTEHAAQWETITIEENRPHGKGIVVKLSGCDSPEQARLYTNQPIAINREELPTLAKEEYYWADLMGLRVITQDGTDLGRIDDILATPANDVLVIKNDRKRLLPYTTEVIQSINLEDKLMIVDWDPEF